MSQKLTQSDREVIGRDLVGRAVDDALSSGDGVMAVETPTLVQRIFCRRAGNFGLDYRDSHAYRLLGLDAGAIDESWFASGIRSLQDNGPWHEGLTHYRSACGKKTFSLRDALAERSVALLGDGRKWKIYAKFFDNKDEIFDHMHDDDAAAAESGQDGKIESYYIPPEMNNGPWYHPPVMFTGLLPCRNETERAARKKQVRQFLENWGNPAFDMRRLAQAYLIYPEFALHMLPGMLHGPAGGICHFEIMNDSDVFRMFTGFQNEVVTDTSLLMRGVPGSKQGNLDWIMRSLNWEANTDPYYFLKNQILPRPVEHLSQDGIEVTSRIYGARNKYYMRTIRIPAGKNLTLNDGVASAIVTVAGHGKIGKHVNAWPGTFRLGQSTNFEHFVSHNATPRIEAGGDNLSLIQFFDEAPADCDITT